MDDFDEVRAWLGYGKINLVGGSYGTRTAQTYLRRHPESVRTVTLWGVVPMGEPIAFSHAAYGQRALDLVLGWCEADAVCRGRFPSPRADFQAVMDRLDQGPEAVRSDLPVLLVNGEADPVTPPEFGRRAARFLTRSLHLAEPYASHEESSPCVEGIANEFVRRGTAEGLDTSCLREVKPRPFLTEPPKESIAPFG